MAVVAPVETLLHLTSGAGSLREVTTEGISAKNQRYVHQVRCDWD
jgi:hypothetical protein